MGKYVSFICYLFYFNKMLVRKGTKTGNWLCCIELLKNKKMNTNQLGLILIVLKHVILWPEQLCYALKIQSKK